MSEFNAVPAPTFVVTLELDPQSFSLLNGWRTSHFPLERNFLPAHLTLFHTVSGEQIERLRTAGPEWAKLPSIELLFTALRWVGNGVSVEVESAALTALRARLVEVLAGTFTRQDQQRFRPHVTIQNKVDAETSRTLCNALQADFHAWRGEGTAILVWRYLGGPWDLEFRLGFAART